MQPHKPTNSNRPYPLPRWRAAVEALENRHFRWYWLGRLTSLAAFQMDGVAQGWLTYALTGSAMSLGWISAARSLSLLLFSLYGGALSDRLQKRRILIAIRWIRLISHLVIAILISVDAIQVWHLAVRSLLSGVLLAIIMPAERAIVPELVDRQTLLNAFALSSIATGLMGMFAAWVAGLLIDTAGIAVVYYAIVVFHLLTALLVARLPASARAPLDTQSLWRSLFKAVQYVSGQPILPGLLGLALATTLFGRPYSTLMPPFAQEVMGFGASGLGLLTAAPQLGSLLSALAMASLGRFQAKGKLLLAAGLLWGIALLCFGNAQFLPIVVISLVVAGAASNTCFVTTQALLQVNADTRFHGRVMSLQIMMSGLALLGTLPASAVADWQGVPVAVSVLGLLLALAFLGIAVARPQLRYLS
jgi:MFS family permease